MCLIDFYGTTGGDANTVIQFTLPINAASGFNIGGGAVPILNAGSGGLGAFQIVSSTLGGVIISTAGNWSLGATTGPHTGGQMLYAI